jgi:hypothetical protein
MNKKLVGMLQGVMVSTVILGLVCCLMWAVSYNTYLDLHRYRASFELHTTAISFYSEKGVQEFNGVPGKEITDLKYNNYQHTMGELIRDLRNTVDAYNRILVSKRQIKSTLMWSWMIVSPDDDMQPIVLSQFLKKGN